jgi:hypothetical protein
MRNLVNRRGALGACVCAVGQHALTSAHPQFEKARLLKRGRGCSVRMRTWRGQGGPCKMWACVVNHVQRGGRLDGLVQICRTSAAELPQPRSGLRCKGIT